MASDPLALRARIHLPIPLHCATLERQLLLRRAAMTARQAVGHLAGLQAQAPLAPYVGLWTRLAGFRPQQLENLLTKRAVVRAHLMRNTVHLVTAEDVVSFRPPAEGARPLDLGDQQGPVKMSVSPRYRDARRESVHPARSGQLAAPGPQRDGQGITVVAWTTRRSWLTSTS